jgi:anti-anti-sigma regulatory factor
MNKPFFEINENGGIIELKAFGELTVSHADVFRLHLLKLLKHGKSKSYKLNLKQASAVDASSLQLIYILKRELTAVNASLAIEMPEELAVTTFLIKTGILEMLS